MQRLYSLKKWNTNMNIPNVLHDNNNVEAVRLRV